MSMYGAGYLELALSNVETDIINYCVNAGL